MSLRAIWKGTIGFGLVSIPVKMFHSIQETTPRLHLVHAECGTRIQQKRYCPNCQRLIEWKEVKSGYEVTKDRHVIVEEEELESLPLKTLKSIDIQEFIDISQIDPRACYDSYYLVPEEEGVKPFWLLLKAMEATKLVAIGKLGYREREYLALIRPFNNLLLLQTLHYADQIRDPKEIPPLSEVAITERELSLAITLIGTLKNEKFDWNKYQDEYGQALSKLIEAKIQGLTLIPPRAEAKPKVLDLAETLLASIQASQK